MVKKITLFFLFLTTVYLLLTTFKYYSFLTKTLKISPVKTLLSLDSLKTYDNNVTVLILGIPGKNHDGGTLTDSIIVANYNLKTHKLLTISIPRDIWSKTLQDKINTAYAYGEAKQKNGGLKLAKAEIEAVVGIPIQYATVIDFDKFREIVDLLGGVEIDVERSFVDKQFPIAGKEDNTCGGDPEFKCRYETISFKKGPNHMDGATALKYTRSRHAIGIEGGDFARNKRQQKMLQAIKKKFFISLKQFNIDRWKELYQAFEYLLIRDITNQQLAIILKNIVFAKNFSQSEVVLSQDFFTASGNNAYNGQYILLPKSGNFSDTHRYIQSKTRQTH